MAHMRSRPFSRVHVICTSSLPAKTLYFSGGGGDKTPILSTSDFSTFAPFSNPTGSLPKPTNQQQQQPPNPLPQRIPASNSSTPTKYGSLGGVEPLATAIPLTHHHYHHHQPSLDKDPSLQPIGSIPSLRQTPSEQDGGGPGVLPIALEPTDDGIAAVATVILELPRGAEGGRIEEDVVLPGQPKNVRCFDVPPDRICLGSSLVMMRVLYPALLSHAQGARSILVHRRRNSQAAS